MPEAFDLSKKLMPSFGISHFTWDWFFEKVCKVKKKELKKMENSFNNCDYFFFPPFTPDKILLKYKKKISNINFIVGDFKKIKKGNNLKKCLIMDNGKRSLSTLIDKTVPYLEKIKDIEFYISIDYLSEKFKSIIYNSDNIVPVSGVKDMHQRLAETDFLIARGGFNTISECLVLKNHLFFREENNDEIVKNLRQIYNKRLKI